MTVYFISQATLLIVKLFIAPALPLWVVLLPTLIIGVLSVVLLILKIILALSGVQK